MMCKRSGLQQDFTTDPLKDHNYETNIYYINLIAVMGNYTLTTRLSIWGLAYLFMANPMTFNLKRREKSHTGLSPFFISLLFLSRKFNS